MNARRSRVAVLLLVASASLASEPRFLGEVRYEDQSRRFHRLSNRFVEVGREWEQGDAAVRLSVAHYRVVDLIERKLIRVSIPLTAVREQNRAILGRAAVPTLVHHDGLVSTVLFNQTQTGGYSTIAKWLGQYDHGSGQFSELVKIGDDTAAHLVGELDFDPLEKYLYFADFIDEGGDIMHHRATSMRLKRISLHDRRTDWELDLAFPKRARSLELTGPGWLFDPAGKRLALFEYDDKSGQRHGPVTPPAQVYVIDVEARTIDAYPIPLSAYARFFTPDGQFLVIGSNELGQIIRIDLKAKRVDASVKGHSLLHAFAVTPSGKTFLSFANTELSSPKVVEVRRTDTFALVAAIPVRLLVPGSDHAPTTVLQFNGGRQLVFPTHENEVAPTARAIRFFELPDDVDRGSVEGSTEPQTRLATGVVAALQQASLLGLEVPTDKRVGDPAETFAMVVVNPKADAFLVGIRSGNRDGDYKAGRTKPVVIRVDSRGTLRWERTLTAKPFTDYEAGGVAATSDGGCVVRLLSYVHDNSTPVARFVKLDASGRIVWDTRFRGAGGPDTRVADSAQLLPNGSIAVTGRVSTAQHARAWHGELDSAGKIVLDRESD